MPPLFGMGAGQERYDVSKGLESYVCQLSCAAFVVVGECVECLGEDVACFRTEIGFEPNTTETLGEAGNPFCGVGLVLDDLIWVMPSPIFVLPVDGDAPFVGWGLEAKEERVDGPFSFDRGITKTVTFALT